MIFVAAKSPAHPFRSFNPGTHLTLLESHTLDMLTGLFRGDYEGDSDLYKYIRQTIYDTRPRLYSSPFHTFFVTPI